MEYNKEQLVVIPVQQLIEIVGSVIDSKMEFWLNKMRAEEMQERHDKEVMLTINEVVKKYKISRSTVYNKTKSGEIPCSHIGAKILISKADIEKTIKNS